MRGVTVGHATIIRGAGRLAPGKGPVRTGVTAIFPRGRDDLSPVFAGWFSLNGNGEMTGTAWIDDYGLLFYPIAITNTNSVGTVRDALIEWGATRLPDALHCCLPVVAETWDGDLSDIFGFHVNKAHVFDADRRRKEGPVAEGNVGGGTGMLCLGFKGGIGTASRRLPPRTAGSRWARWCSATSAFGVSSGSPGSRWAGSSRSSTLLRHERAARFHAGAPALRARQRRPGRGAPRETSGGSIIVVLATDAPLCRISSGASPGGPRSASVAWARSRRPARATCSSPSPQRRRARRMRAASPRFEC